MTTDAKPWLGRQDPFDALYNWSISQHENRRSELAALSLQTKAELAALKASHESLLARISSIESADRKVASELLGSFCAPPALTPDATAASQPSRLQPLQPAPAPAPLPSSLPSNPPQFQRVGS